VKLRIYHRPWLVVALAFGIAAAWSVVAAAAGSPRLGAIAWGLAAAYAVVMLAAGLFAVRCWLRERPFELCRPERALVVSPHQDDCVLMAGGFGVRNRRLGGSVDIVYLTVPCDPVLAEARREEAISAWRLADVSTASLWHWNIIPAQGAVTRDHVQLLASELQRLVDEIQPTVVFTPLFEAGHLHHDITHHVVTRMLRLPAGTRIYECPEYSPYLSFWRTPQAMLSHLVRFAFLGLAAYYPKAEGTGSSGILNLRLTRSELAVKRRMLAEFRSQHGEALARHHGYADRFIIWRPRPFAATPFRYEGSRPWLIERLGAGLPARLIRRLLPGEAATIGVDCGITNLSFLVEQGGTPAQSVAT
jgi:LmbE family N-acetylglucosaminyl deacetylase